MKLAAAIAAAALVGCGVVPVGGSRYAAERSALPGQGTLFLYSPTTFHGNATCPRFKLSGSSAVPLPNGSYSRFDLSPGSYRMESETSWCFAVAMSGTVRVADGQKVFVKFDRKSGYWPGATRAPGPVNTWFGFELVPEGIAERELVDLGRTN